ncbi:MAG: hypothetical protein GY861_08320 [bacterium]|nr:hypothetical protein [bacterium]
MQKKEPIDENNSKRYCKVCYKELQSWQIIGICNQCEYELSLEEGESEEYDFTFADYGEDG